MSLSPLAIATHGLQPVAKGSLLVAVHGFALLVAVISKPGGAGSSSGDDDWERADAIRRNNQVAMAFLLTLAASGALN